MAITSKVSITSFGLGEQPNVTSIELLGGKGAGLVYMSSMGVPVPPGFVIPTSVCLDYFKSPSATIRAVATAIKPYLKKMYDAYGYMPLVSVRSGARASMPGMMDTILNVGLDGSNAPGWISRIGAECVSDSRRRLIEMFASVVCGMPRSDFAGKSATECNDVYRASQGSDFPGASEQLIRSIEAVFKSWNNERAKIYRQMNGIPESWGTAVVVQAMVFGNMNDNSATGVLFTRNPDTGEPGIVGEFLPKAQGEDVVAGTSTPRKLNEMALWNKPVFDQLREIATNLEQARRDVQDIEFTVQDGKLYILQTRSAKRTSTAVLRTAIDMLDEGLILPEIVLKRVTLGDYNRVKQDVIDPSFSAAPVLTGIPACSGVVVAKVVHSAAAAVGHPERVILVSEETTPDDLAGMRASVGVITMRGGATSHAAVVARAMNLPCIVGVGGSVQQLPEGSLVSMDGATGRVWLGLVPVVSGAENQYAARVREIVMSIYGSRVRLVSTSGAHIDGSCMSASQLNAAITESLKHHQNVTVFTGFSGKETFNSYLGSAVEQTKVEDLFNLLDPADISRVRLVTDVPKTNFKVVTAPKSAQEIVEAEGEIINTHVVTAEPWMRKLLEMKQATSPVSLLSVDPFDPKVNVVTYTSEAQLLSAVLGN